MLNNGKENIFPRQISNLTTQLAFYILCGNAKQYVQIFLKGIFHKSETILFYVFRNYFWKQFVKPFLAKKKRKKKQ
jgi:hypothetical protein